MPSIGTSLTDGAILLDEGSRINRQVERHDGVAAVQGREGRPVVARRVIDLVVPAIGLALADLGRDVGSKGRIDGSDQLVDGVATEDGLQAIHIGAGSRDRAAVPFVRHILAEGDGIRIEVYGILNEVEVSDGIAAVLRLEGSIVVTLRRVELTVPCVALTVADLRRVVRCVGRIDAERELVDTVAAVDGQETVVVRACRLQHAIAPQIACSLTCLRFFRKEIHRIDRQNKGINAVAALTRRERIGIDARLRNELSVPYEVRTRAHLHGVREMVRSIDGQIQAVDTVATIGGLQRVEVDARLRQRAPAPYEGFAGTDCAVGLRHITRHNGKVQRADTVATVLRGQGTGIGILHRDPASHPRIRFAVADGIIDDGLVRGVHRQHQRVDAITAVFRQEGIGIDTGLR